MSKSGVVAAWLRDNTRVRFYCRAFATLFLPLLGVSSAKAQERRSYSFARSVAVGVEYSHTSSHILLAATQNRKIASLDVDLSRRLLHTRFVDWQYDLLLRPVMFIEDPTETAVYTGNGETAEPPPNTSGPALRACVSGTFAGYGYTVQQQCGSRWTYAAGLSPFGQRLNLLPRHRLQPTLLGSAGLVLSTRDIPVDNSEKLNFIFDFGAGLDWVTTPGHSISVEYRIQHLSNAYRGQSNPGIDSQIGRVLYRFGR